MMVLEGTISQEIVQRLGWTLLHFVWQAAVVALLLAILLRVLRKTSANLRYIIACLALALVVLLPVITIQLVPLSVPHSEQKTEFSRQMTEGRLQMAELPSSVISPPSSVLKEPVQPETAATKASWKQHTIELFEPALPYIVLGWLIGVFGLSVWHLGGWAQLQRLRRKMVKKVNASLQSKLKELADKLKVNRLVLLLESALVEVPTVVGWLRPVILLPASALIGLSTEQLEAMLAHELAHIKRFDYLVNMLQTVVEILGFYHPAVWWISHKIRAERENCCDDLAVAVSGDRVRYARALTLMEEIRASRGELAIAASGGSLFARISRLVGKESSGYSRDGWLPSVIAILLIAVMIIPTTIALTSGATKEPIAEQKEKSTKSLHEAAADGDIELVKSLISKGADVNERGGWGNTPLHHACRKGHAEVAKLLISKGAYVNARSGNAPSTSGDLPSRSGMTPLHYAAASGDKQTVKLLLSKGADINAKNTGGMTPLFEAMKSPAAARKEIVELLMAKGAKVPAFHLAAFMGDMEKLKKYLQNGTVVNSQKDAGCSALHAAANGGKKDVVEFLIGKGADIDAKDGSGLTPLYYAAIHNYEDIADLLLAKGADVNAKHDYGYTLLHYAIFRHESKDAVKLLISKGANVNVGDDDGFTPLMWATWWADKDMVELLISKGADVNQECNYGCTALHYVAIKGKKDLVELLIAKGAAPISAIHLAVCAGDLVKVKSLVEEGADVDTRAKGSGGHTPLFAALFAGHNDVAKFLIAKGADVNAKDMAGVTALHYMCEHGKRSMAELLIAEGADVNAKDYGGATPLHRIFYSGRSGLDVAELLLAKGADVNAKLPDEGWMGCLTPLHFAVESGDTKIVGLFIGKGADINAPNSDGEMPLHIACKWGHKDVVELLVAKGADMNAKDSKGQTALSLAKEQGYTEIVELLRKHGARE